MKRYLEQVRIGRYGALHDVDLGPFGPGLNVVYGPNEAGKSSVASFVAGVLFGWEEARGVRNTYRPAEGERSGTLDFAEVDEGPAGEGWSYADGADAPGDAAGVVRGTVRVGREHNADGLVGDRSIVADVDNATYRTMFWLTSDELRSLRNTSDVTARLLAAGSATGSSPASAFVELEQRIAAVTAPAGEGSIAGIEAALDDVRAQIADATDQVNLLKQEDRERAQLVESRALTAVHIDELNGEISTLYDARARLESIDAQVRTCDEDAARLREERAQVAGQTTGEIRLPSPLARLDAAAERSLRDELDELADEQARAQRSLDIAQENAAASSASYEALLEMDVDDAEKERSLSNRRMQAVVSVLLPVAFAALGLAVFAYGRQTSSLSFTVFGGGLMAASILLAVGAIATFLRPNKGAEALEGRRKDAQWVMLQDQKKLEASAQAKQQVEERIARRLEECGLGGAAGSVRQARILIDEAREERAHLALTEQRVSSLDMRISSAVAARRELEAERARIEHDCDMPTGVSIQHVDALLRDKTAQRDALSAAHDDMNLRFGELDQRLAQMRDDRTLDALKLEYHQLRCRLREAKHNLVTLLLAKRMLEKSIVAWESRNQPEVYAQASRLFCTITAGAWESMRMTAEGRLVAVSAAGEARDVRHLSLGTCQQLYLSLKVAMLLHARNVGRAIPVIADDILVNFDSDRQQRAADVLAELARGRQLIVFTCHRSTVDALRQADPSLAYLEM